MQSAQTSGTSSDKVWQAIWRMEVPPKVRVFWWRVVHGFLPARHVLYKRHIDKVANCEVCGAEGETIKHVLMDCTITQSFWRSAREVTGIKVPILHDHTWARDLLCDQVCSRKEAATIMCGMWSLWMMRNSRKHDQPVIPMAKAIQWVWDTAYDLWSMLHQNSGNKKEKQQQWMKPQQNWFKCNVDGSFMEDDQTGSFAVVLQDENGVFQAAVAEWKERGHSALMMEALACRLGVKLGRDRGIRKMCLETDCLELICLWRDGNEQRSPVSFILQEIRTMCRGFDEFTLSFAPRQCNRVAHVCARQVSREEPVGEWLTNPPLALQNLIYQDCNLISLN